jgi:penicillin amidase
MLDAKAGTRALAAVAATLVVLVLGPASARSSGSAGSGARVDTAAGDSAVANGGVVIRRDSWGVPQIFAHTVYDLFYGYGYAVAQDRLFQMEMSKRSVNGTVAEVLGGNYVAYDSEVRANRDPDSLRRQYDAMAARDRQIFEGYAAGVNAWITAVTRKADRLMPKEFRDYDFSPSPWTGMDVAMIFVGTMANRYSDSTAELTNLQVRDQLVAKYGEARGLALFDQLIWNYDPLAPTTVPGPTRRADITGTSEPAGHKAVDRDLMPVSAEAAKAVPPRVEPPPAFSNVWLTGRTKTLGARSVLVNGPQFGWYNPAYTYSIGLHGAGFNVVGNTPFAYPVILFGHNDRIAWGATAGVGDTVDIYQEHLRPGDIHSYLFKGQWRQMRHRSETVNVRGGSTVTVNVYYTVHGRVISTDAARTIAYAKKRSWEGSEIESLLGWIHSTQAQNYRQWRAQSARMAISINWYYADDQGNIAYVLNGKYPDRPAGQDQRLPAVGTGEMEWRGIRPYATNPQVFNPRQGFIANWNNKQAPSSTGPFSVVDRVDLILRELRVPGPLTPDDLWDIVYRTAFGDPSAHYFLPYLQRAVAHEPAGSELRRTVAYLLAWDQLNTDTDRNGTYDSPAVTVFRTFLQELISLVLSDDLDSALFPSFFANGYPTATNPPGDSQRPGLGVILAYNALLGKRAGVPQRVNFLNGVSPDDVVRRALAQALDKLRARYGPDRSRWLTPTVPHVFRTTNFAGIPQADANEQLQLPTFMNRGTENDQVIFYARNRVAACEVAPPGQSGFVAPDGTKSPHYSDQMELYYQFECKRTWFYPRDVDTRTVVTEHLDP